MVHDNQRFTRLESLDNSLQVAFTEGRINLSAANTLVGLSTGTQRRVARWLGRNPGRKIGKRNARRLIQAQLKGLKLDYKGIEHVLGSTGKRSGEEYLRIPMSSLPDGLTKKEAQIWVKQAIEAYQRERRGHTLLGTPLDCDSSQKL